MNRISHSSDWISFFNQGEQKALEYFFHQYYSRLCLFVFRITQDKGIAEEIATDGFVKLWDRRTTFDTEGGIRAFLYTVARNAAISWLRKDKIGKATIRSLSTLPIDEDPTAFQHEIAAETYQRLHRAVQDLPTQCGLIFSKLFYEGKTCKEIAREMNLAITTVRSQKMRAIRLLKGKLVAWAVFLAGVVRFWG